MASLTNTNPSCPLRRTLLKGYSPSLLSDTIWKAGFFNGGGEAQIRLGMREELSFYMLHDFLFGNLHSRYKAIITRCVNGNF